MRNILYLIVFSFLLFISSCSESTENIPVRQLTNDEKQLVSSGNNFGLKLFREVNREEGDKNIVISPLSVSMALGMTVNGAAGSTRDSMLYTLDMIGLTMDHVNSSYKSLINLLLHIDSKVQFELANSIWYRNTFPFEQSFFNLCGNYFNAQVTGLNFDDPASKDIINNWVNTNTKGKIKEIIDNINPLSMMFLINAIYFKGNWSNKFDTNKTKDNKFYLIDGSSKDCRMMNQKAYLPYFSNEEFQAVDLQYGNKNYSMTIFLPKSDKNINDFINELTDDNYTEWLTRFTSDSVTISMPKYKIEYELKLNDALKNLGMSIAFEDGKADFTGMSELGRLLIISEVKHKTFIKVDEEGTEAAAVTSVEMGPTSLPGDIIIRIDRPFVFVIREKNSGSIVFIGKIVEPLN
ncbi:MAG: serpin family protein [Bacteroidetes bacterium]|nr:MAG: serpin family protein [Bacteroidota bacterium]